MPRAEEAQGPLDAIKAPRSERVPPLRHLPCPSDTHERIPVVTGPAALGSAMGPANGIESSIGDNSENYSDGVPTVE
jgi:hypothetical protein